VSETSPRERTYVARVQWLDVKGEYAMTHVSGIGKVTFSYNPDDNVWTEGDLPIKGAKVVLSNLLSMVGGWRAFKARYFRPEDEDCQQTSN